MASNSAAGTPSKIPAPLQNLTPSRASIDIPPRNQPSPGIPSHRQSLADSLRGVPQSPRMRHGSISHIPIQDIVNNPPTAKQEDSPFAGRDWRGIRVGELVDRGLVRFAELDTNVEDATNLLISSGSPNVVLLRSSPTSQTAVGTFDYSDLNAYLLLVVGLAQPDSEHASDFAALAQKGREGKPIPLRDVKSLGNKEPLLQLPFDAPLAHAVEMFGGGAHRILVMQSQGSGSEEAVVGVLTQLRLVNFFWEHGKHFANIEPLYTRTLQELGIGSRGVMAINGDRPLTDALELMDHESITSLPVLDNARNVVGNISQVDVRLLTKNTSLPLLRSSCIHFISVILNERGVNDGKDSFPVFHVNPFNTLAHTVAKLVATRSHRMWVVDSPSPSSSDPSTPLLAPSHGIPPPASLSSSNSPNANTHAFPQLPASQIAAPPATTVSAAALPGANLSGHLSGVVSLTDILNLFARASGLNPHDPSESRAQRRRGSSSSSLRSGMRGSVDSLRSDSVGPVSGSAISESLSRSGSISSRRPG